jgi:hypothetical protein
MIFFDIRGWSEILEGGGNTVMIIGGTEIGCNSSGLYDAYALHKASASKSDKGPEAFISQLIGIEEEYASHLERKFGSRPGLFFSKWLSVIYASWISKEFFSLLTESIEENFFKHAYALGAKSSESEELQRRIFDEGLAKGQETERVKFSETLSSMPAHPLQIKSINTLELWKKAMPQEDCISSEFIKYMLLAAQVYRDLDRDDVISTYDWSAESYWITPEFAFYVLSYFPFGSQQKANGLSYLQEISNGRVWANSLG